MIFAALFVAGACPDAALDVIPRGTLPQNVVLRVLFSDDTVTARELGERSQILASALVKASDAVFVLRSQGAVIASTTAREPTLLPTFTVRPAEPLVKDADYELVLSAIVISRFRTAVLLDETPPTFEATASYRRWKPAHDWKDPSGSFVELAAKASADTVGFLVFKDDVLRTVIRNGPVVRFGVVDSCKKATFAFAPPERVQVRAFDAAGNTSAPVAVELTRPK